MLKSGAKVIAVCSAGINSDYNDSLWGAFHSLANLFDFKILFFNSFSDLYSYEKHDIGESNIFQLMNYEILDGVIILSETIKYKKVCYDIIEKANAYNIPVVSMDATLDGCYSVNFEYAHAMEEIIEHLINVHHYTKINFIAGIKGNPYSEERLEMYRRVLERHNIPVEEERIGYGDFWSQPTKKVIDQFIASDLPFPEAIVCANDGMAIAAFKYLQQSGYEVPKDVALTGMDGIREAMEHAPMITTSHHDYYNAVITAFKVLESLFKGERPPKQSWVSSKVLLGGTCGCQEREHKSYNTLARELYEQIDDYNHFNEIQVALAADLTDNDSFWGVFDNLTKYADNFCSDRFWLCIVDDFLSEKEVLADIIEESSFKRIGYSTRMDIMLSRENGEWQGITDFDTSVLLPKLEEVLEEENNVMFLPLHVLEQTIGYVALVFDPDIMRMNYAYQFFMNISNALETTKTHQRQQAIINNLEIKYIHDPMTGLFNRRGFYQRLEPVYNICAKESCKVLVMSVDLNGLKQINDTYGHADGDIAITTIGKALSYVASDKHTCARFGGDEFVVAGPVENDEEGEEFYKEVLAYLDRFNEKSNRPYQVSASIGYVTGTPDNGITLDEFIKAADEKMYQEKVRYHSRQGR